MNSEMDINHKACVHKKSLARNRTWMEGRLLKYYFLTWRPGIYLTLYFPHKLSSKSTKKSGRGFSLSSLLLIIADEKKISQVKITFSPGVTWKFLVTVKKHQIRLKWYIWNKEDNVGKVTLNIHFGQTLYSPTKNTHPI